MKIALLTDGIYPHVIGGMQKHSFYLAKFLAAAGMKIDLYHIVNDKYDELDGFSEEEKKNIRSVPVVFPDFGKMPGHYIRESYEFSIRIYKKMKEASRPDFIYAKGFTAWEILNRRSKGEQFPLVGVNFHGYEMFQRQPSLRSSLESRLLLRHPVLYNVKNADVVFSYGGKITPLIEVLGVPRKKIIELPTGISPEWTTDKVSEVHDPRKIVFIGRNERRKGVEELNDVLKNLKEDFEFHFIGPVPESKKIRNKKIKYHGEMREAGEIKKILVDSDVLVCPSHSEGMPNVVMEALACGMAVIATDTGATSVMVDDSVGWLIPPGDRDFLQKVFSEVLNCTREELMQKKIKAKQKVKQNFLWNDIAMKTVHSIQKFCDENN